MQMMLRLADDETVKKSGTGTPERKGRTMADSNLTWHALARPDARAVIDRHLDAASGSPYTLVELPVTRDGSGGSAAVGTLVHAAAACGQAEALRALLARAHPWAVLVESSEGDDASSTPRIDGEHVSLQLLPDGPVIHGVPRERVRRPPTAVPAGAFAPAPDSSGGRYLAAHGAFERWRASSDPPLRTDELVDVALQPGGRLARARVRGVHSPDHAAVSALVAAAGREARRRAAEVPPAPPSGVEAVHAAMWHATPHQRRLAAAPPPRLSATAQLAASELALRWAAGQLGAARRAHGHAVRAVRSGELRERAPVVLPELRALSLPTLANAVATTGRLPRAADRRWPSVPVRSLPPGARLCYIGHAAAEGEEEGWGGAPGDAGAGRGEGAAAAAEARELVGLLHAAAHALGHEPSAARVFFIEPGCCLPGCARAARGGGGAGWAELPARVLALAACDALLVSWHGAGRAGRAAPSAPPPWGALELRLFVRAAQLAAGGRGARAPAQQLLLPTARAPHAARVSAHPAALSALSDDARTRALGTALALSALAAPTEAAPQPGAEGGAAEEAAMRGAVQRALLQPGSGAAALPRAALRAAQDAAAAEAGARAATAAHARAGARGGTVQRGDGGWAEPAACALDACARAPRSWAGASEASQPAGSDGPEPDRSGSESDEHGAAGGAERGGPRRGAAPSVPTPRGVRAEPWAAPGWRTAPGAAGPTGTRADWPPPPAKLDATAAVGLPAQLGAAWATAAAACTHPVAAGIRTAGPGGPPPTLATWAAERRPERYPHSRRWAREHAVPPRSLMWRPAGRQAL